ncbi:neutral zinc metallopeptidase [Gordonia sp. HY002]|uniref:neutral zinc metallopeptidase n=1 Tax=Gordonia zhenghanii TaxID=2911516 RepID=UPI001EEFA97F|nr:neutral zinc metallopeptidase [Gordonia zhenghanii]MCF8570563.1 neutral zinc metallopeptidase [Gordonia zhenghanii]MCF8607428.1 neutral zinc metallopeptidase [Gordonia zhenghanii]
MRKRSDRRNCAKRVMSALVGVVATSLVVTGCVATQDGSPTRTPPEPPLHCTSTECPELSVFAEKQVADSGVTSQNASERVPAYLTEVLDDLDRTWQDWFAALNIENITPGRALIEPGETFASKCLESSDDVLTSDFPNAMYCTLDNEPDGQGVEREGSIVLPVQTFADIWDGKLFGSDGIMLGDFTAATIVAHEYGHNVMYRLAEAYGMSKSQYPSGDNPELLADCFAGNWAGTVFARKDLSIKEIAQAAVLIFSIGDPLPDQGHGTSIERIQALTRGFTDKLTSGGQPVTCLKTYWPAALGS